MSDFHEVYIFSTYFLKNPQISNFMKIRQVGAELFHVDRQTDITKLIVAFRRFVKSPENKTDESEATGGK